MTEGAIAFVAAGAPDGIDLAAQWAGIADAHADGSAHRTGRRRPRRPLPRLRPAGSITGVLLPVDGGILSSRSRATPGRLSDFFPPFIRPPGRLPCDGRRIVPSEHVLTMFFEIDEPSRCRHRHGASGASSSPVDGLEIDGDAHVRGDAIVPRCVHTADRAGYKGIDVFADADR